MLWNADLLSEMERLRSEMDSLFSGFGREAATTYPRTNVYENRDAITVTAELPGLSKERVAITFADGVLAISGKQEPHARAKDMSVIRQERPTGEFEKTVRIPFKVDQQNIRASFSNGILSVVLPKTEEAKPKTITIEAR